MMLTTPDDVTDCRTRCSCRHPTKKQGTGSSSFSRQGQARDDSNYADQANDRYCSPGYDQANPHSLPDSKPALDLLHVLR